MSGDTYNQPSQPSYGEGMRDALKAQVELLKGTGDFASTGSLESLLPLEESVRKKTAQTDTDVLRQTLLGSTTGGGEQEVTYDANGRIVIGREEAPGYEIKQSVQNYDRDTKSFVEGFNSKGSNKVRFELYSPEGKLLTFVEETPIYDPIDNQGKTLASYDPKALSTKLNNKIQDLKNVPDEVKSQFATNLKGSGYLSGTTEGQGNGRSSVNYQISAGEGAPIYAKDTDGNIIQDASKAGTTEVTTLPTQRTGDGMVDLIGDKRELQGMRPDYEQYVRQNSDILRSFEIAKAKGDTRTIEEFGQSDYEEFGKAEGKELPETFGSLGRSAGYTKDGEFLGLSAFGEDIQAGNLSRQRERDLEDVARLSGTYQDIMEDYKPGTQEALESARSVLESQRNALTGAGAIGVPTGSTFGGEVGGQTFDAATLDTPVDLSVSPSMTGATVGDPLSLTADTSYDAIDPVTGQTLTAGTTYTPSANVQGSGYTAAQAADPLALSAATSYAPSANVQGRGYSAVAGLDGGQIQADSLRARLMADAEAGLDQGLTDREERQIAEAARARSTMMGRTFDQQGAIAEAQARVAEDNARKMQNRVFAQQALGQEAGLQESDLGRALQASMQNQAAQNQALQYSSGQDMQAQLANQAAQNQALQAGMAAGLSQEALSAQQKQAQEFANMQATNRAAEFGSTQALNAALANQQASNRAAEFGVQAGLGREQAQAGFAQQANLANLASEQQRQESGLQAGLGQEQLRANLAQQKAMADAGFTQQARATNLEAGLGQELSEAQLNQARLMANQQAQQQAALYGAESAQQGALRDAQNRQQASQFDVGATMDAQRLNEQLKQSGVLGYIQAAGGLAALEDQSTLDPFQAVLGRGGGGSLQAGQSVFGQAGYGLNSAPQYLNPESGLGFIQNQATNAANMYNARVAADATRDAGMMNMIGSIGGMATGMGAKKLLRL